MKRRKEMKRYFIKSDAGAVKAQEIGLSVKKGVRCTYSHYGELCAITEGWILESQNSRTRLKKEGLLVSSTVFDNIY